MVTNRKAFLDTIGFSEGTINKGDGGYNVLFGGGIFNNYSDHPRVEFPIPRLAISTSAAGKYQFEKKTWDDLAKKLNLKDFSPASQDLGALELIRERRALDAVDAGDLDTAILRCHTIWASFPGAGYGQPEHPISVLRNYYVKAGGQLLQGELNV